jgi:lipoprotein-releasing system ATP-binding protein
MSYLLVDNIRKEYPTRAEPLVVLSGVSLSLNPGENVAILGPSGCGKSTLLQIIGTLDRPTAGRVMLDGCNPLELDEPRLADFRSRKIGFVFQDHHLLPQCNVLENVLLPAMAAGDVDTAAIERARTLLERVGLSGRLDHRPAELSGGERQRAAIARALVNRPALLLADEPTGNLDRATSATVARLLLELQAQEQTMLVVVTHSLELAALFQRRLELNAGQLAELQAV